MSLMEICVIILTSVVVVIGLVTVVVGIFLIGFARSLRDTVKQTEPRRRSRERLEPVSSLAQVEIDRAHRIPPLRVTLIAQQAIVGIVGV